MRYTGPKVRKARRFGFAFTEKDTRILPKRGFAPGQHGQSRGRLSEYALQLREKQKCKILYGILEKQFYKYFSVAQNQPGVTGDNLIKILEKRLDNIIFRMGFATTRAQSRQLVNHGFFTVNGKNVDIPSYMVKVGDIIAIKSNKQSSKYITLAKEKLKSSRTQDWLDLDSQKLVGKVLSEPTPEQVGNQISLQLIVEHYSRI